MSVGMDDRDNTGKALRIGARGVVELLRLYASEPASDRIKLVPARNRNAIAVLRDKLTLVQQSLHERGRLSAEGTRLNALTVLVDRCGELQIPLPVAEPDWGVISLLDYLFDELLGSSGLDEQALDWLASLRLPVIRYALLDYSFFFAPQNLVRRFLNQVHLSLLSSSPKSRQVLREVLGGFIQRIDQDFRQDVSAFNSICIEAQAWFAGHDDRVGQIEEQLRTQESTRRKERVSEPRVVALLNRTAAGKTLPKLLVDFLHGEWRKSLRLVSMREGEEGATWKRQVRITESLVEFALECGDEKGREKHRSFYPVLMKNIRTLLLSASDDPQALEQAIDPLELVLLAMINGAVPEPVQVPELQHAGAVVTTVEVRMVSPRALRQIEALQPGDWVRIKTTDGSHELCRVTIRSADNEPWTLVSQSGKTVIRKNAFQLAQGLEGDVLHIIGQGHWWDQKLEAILADLHQRWLQLQAQPVAVVEEKPQSRIDEILQRAPESPPPAPLPVAIPEPVADETVVADTEDFLVAHPVSAAEREAALQAIDQLQVGGWILQQTSQGEERCKLAVRIRGGEKLVFVNRLGIKVLEIDREPLAELLARGLVTVVDTGAKFSNTLERVVRSIQEDRKSPT